jgi:hypothetical protein
MAYSTVHTVENVIWACTRGAEHCLYSDIERFGLRGALSAAIMFTWQVYIGCIILSSGLSLYATLGDDESCEEKLRTVNTLTTLHESKSVTGESLDHTSKACCLRRHTLLTQACLAVRPN